MELSFGEQVKVILKRKNMTIKQLAEEIETQTGMKMSRQNLTQRLTRDNFQEQDMRMIASVLGCTVSLSLTDASEEAGQAAFSRQENEKSIDLQDALNHQLTIEEVVKAAGKEPLLEAAEEKALRKAEETAHKEAEAAGAGKPDQKRRITVRDLANKAREERLRREAQLLEEARKRAARKEEEDRKQEELKAAEEARRTKLKEAEEARAQEEAKAAEDARQAKLQEQLEQEKAEQMRLENMTEEEKAAQAKAEKEEKERIREIAKRAVAASRREEEKKPAVVDVPVVPPELKTPAADESSDSVPEEEKTAVSGEDKVTGDINPRTGEEYESNVVRSHPNLVGYIQVYDRSEHKWIDMTEWAFLGFQERKKVLLGSEYEPPVYLD